MPRKSEPWFRFYVEAVHDRKLRRLEPAHRWVWVAVLAATKRSPIDGVLMLSERQPLEVDDLADIAAVPVDVAQAALDAFAAVGIVEWLDCLSAWGVPKWSARQFESDSSTERVRKHRETQKERSNGDAVTPSDTDADTEKPPAPEPDGFEQFWELYPSRDGKKVGKAKAHTVWKGMSKAKRDAAMVGVENYRDSGWRPKDAVRWLRDEVWVDWQTPATPDPEKVTPPVRSVG